MPLSPVPEEASASAIEPSSSSPSSLGIDHDHDPTTTAPLENEQHEQTIINFQDYWDVVAPAPNTSVKGQFIKGIFKTIGKQRRISLEVHRIPIPKIPSGLDIEDEDDHDDDSNDDCNESFVEKAFLRLSKKRSHYKKSMAKSNSGASYTSNDDESSVASTADQTLVEFPGIGQTNGSFDLASTLRTVEENKSMHDHHHNQQQHNQQQNGVQFNFESETLRQDFQNRNASLGVSTVTHREKWATKYKFEVSNIKIAKREGNKVSLHLKHSHVLEENNDNGLDFNQERDIHFHSSHEAQDFCTKLERLQAKDKECRIRNYDKATRGLGIATEDMDKKIDFLIEIVGAEKLVVSDIISSDPFVVVKFNNKEIHRTKHISKNLNPIWTLRKKAFFIFTVSPRELFTDLHGLNFIVYDYDLAGNDILGAAALPPKTLFLAHEERLEMEMKPMIIGRKVFPQVPKDRNIGTLSIRCRRATEYDIDFMAKFKEDPKKGKLNQLNHITEAVIEKSKGPNLIKTVITKYKTTVKDEQGNKIHKYKLRPGPDPDNSLVEWMTSEDIDAEVMKKSRSFKNLGAGGIAKIHLEILSCDDLPNLENIKLFGNKTDAFVQVVYEDCISETCVIDDSNAPRWMPWTKRAFTLHTRFPSSVIYIGVHDFDAGASIISDHDLVGRCAVNVSSLKPNTEYLLDYALHNTSMKLERKRHGSIKIRLRVEVDDPRAYLLACFSIPPPIYVNSKESKKFQCLRNTINGDYDMSEYSLPNIIMLAKEILQQKRVIHYAKRIIADCFFWRARTKLTLIVPWFLGAGVNSSTNESDSWFQKYFGEREIMIPFNSTVVFYVGINVVENPHLLPSLTFFSLGWLLITTKNFRASYPNPWWRSATFTEMCLMLLLGKQATVSPEKIGVNESAQEAQEADEYWEKLIEDEEKKALRIRMEIAEEQLELEKDLLETKGDGDDISTKVANVSLDPLILVKPYVFPLQQMLIQLCNVIRIVKNILLWEDSHYSFLLSLVAFGLAVIFRFLPWVFIIRWFARILVWVLLGPWMRFLDPTRKKKMTAEDIDTQEAINRLKRKMDRDKTLSHARIQNENARKYRDFKMYFFGKYLTRVPIFQVDRYPDLPLPSSSAVPIEKNTMTFGELAIEESGEKEFETGQHLVGVMIPKIRQCIRSTVAPTGQLARRKSMIKIGDLGADVGDDSALVAYAKLGSIGVFAAVVSYIMVPILIRVFNRILYIVEDKEL